ncbi:MAG: hypothetical protein HND39_05070 [Ignavibacteriota bacterium]|jgi:hypothetical protein|nr:MAG: hypothetical protein EDM72_00595 [Chlorobiota bacterium]MBE7475633.1 hypothetical protein [Ignavibacteriales bacterium]MBL1123057.1 hypothetical protein [Ignavibacteriota bacterium]MCC7095314.1 hypothetical protein [Ignavibacteriaceae bacterium]MCE7855729.1 hypothetical protein [Ignavibacteria bacterium CHB3]
MNIKNTNILILLLLLIVSFNISILSEDDKKNNSNTFQKPTDVIVRTYTDINNILTVHKNDGITDIDVNEQNSGLVYPKGSGKTAVFQSGFLWGCLKAGVPQVGGTAYRTGQQSGKILNSGVPVAQLQAGPEMNIFRVRPDVYPGGPPVDLSSDATLEASSESALRAQYESDWNNWPAADGAPYDDVDENGVYDPAIDIPGVPGANQTIWFVTNDLDAQRVQNLYGAAPLGIEMQETIWAYSQTGALGSMFFRKFVLINKSDAVLDSMYVSMWSDVDLGNSSDDYAGCDVELSLGYVYNANATDATYNPLPPPAVGFDFFQGPITAGGDTLPMTAYYYFARGDANVTDPTQGDIQGSYQFYNFFRGRIGKTGEPFVDPTTGLPTSFTLSGDPQTGQGWLDGQLLPAGDRRIGSASGPFQFEPGDTQIVVVAEIVAGAIPGVDRISAVGLLKYYDQVAQVAYDNNFDLPVPPPAPAVTVSELNEEIVLDWSKDNSKVLATETSDSKGYRFQGYNIYQLPSASASVSEGVRIATYDLIDQVGKINDLVFDIKTGSVVVLPVQFGNDTGIKRYISIKNDAIKQTPLINGIRYYFAVTAYNYNSDPEAVPNNLENPISILTVVPHSPDPGVTYGEGNGTELEFTHSGTADGTLNLRVVDPAATTGHDYQIFFSERQEIRDANGDWVPASVVNRNMNSKGPDTLTNVAVDIAAVYGAQSGKLELKCMLSYESPDADWVDGLIMVFPPGVTILEAPAFDAGNDGSVYEGHITPVIIGNTIVFGDSNRTGNGSFVGGEEWSIMIQGAVPIDVYWKVYDDGYGGGPLDGEGTTTITTVGFNSRLAKYWNLTDLTSNSPKLENQSVIDGIDIYPDRDDISTNFGIAADPIIDGIQVGVSVGYAAPLTFSENNPPSVNGVALSFDGSQWSNDNYILNDFIYFGYPDGLANSSLPVYGGAGGTLDVNILQQDYEFRWTGVFADTTINGVTIKYVQSGGSYITIFGASGYSLADHPLNPSPGVDQRFAIKVPFEIWNIDANQQVNALFWDRSGNPTVNGGAAWNTTNREYMWIVNTPYSTDPIDEASQTVADNATWNLVLYKSTFTTGDIFRFNYDNPIQIGTDTYNYKTTAATFSTELAKDQVDEINVFPNPYYGVNSEELNKYNRFVTFTHLPEQATIRIFNLAGVHVRTIQKDDSGQFQRWDLANENGLPVASGLYIAYIDMPVVGTTKILKLAIIQEQQILDRF